jgi:hypothetical protein
MDEVEELIARLQHDGRPVWLAGPQPEDAIVELETVLGMPLPPTYRSFVARFGGFSLLNSIVSGIIGGNPLASGIGRLYWDTQRFRRDYRMPDHLFVIQPNEDAPYCLDAQKRRPDGEMPVVCFELHSKHMGRMASSFGEWFCEYLRLRLDDDE